MAGREETGTGDGQDVPEAQSIPKPDDVADALAVAICHAHSYTLNSKLNEVLRK